MIVIVLVLVLVLVIVIVIVIGPEEISTLVWGRRKRPPTKMGLT